MAVEDFHFADLLDESFNELVLALMLREIDFLAKARWIVKPQYFSAKAYQVICSTLFDYWDNFQCVPTQEVLVVALSKHIAEPVLRLAHVEILNRLYALKDEDLDKPFVEQELAEFAARAEAAVVVATCFRDLKQFPIGKAAVDLDRIQKIPALFTNLGTSVREDWTRIYNDLPGSGFPTGYTSFDRAMRGGARAGELVVILAPLKRGKSLLLINIGAGLLQMGFDVVHYTLEMYEQDVLRRYLACLTGKPINSIHEYGQSIRDLQASLHIYTDADIIIKEFPGHEVSLPVIDGHLSLVETRRKDKRRKVVAVLDYADLCVKTDLQKKEWQALEEIYVGLRNMGRRHEIPIFTASQTNVGGFNAEVLDATHQSGSTRKGFVADYMFGVQQTDVDYSVNRFTMVPFLNRHERKDLKSFWRAQYECSKIEEITEDEFLDLAPDVGISLRGRNRGMG